MRPSRARAVPRGRTPRDTEERSYQLLGLRWAGADRGDAAEAGARSARRRSAPMAAGARSPGGRATSYSTGQALVALHDGGGVAIIDASWQRGIEYLLKTQAADGTWHATSRLHPPAPLSPPYFDAGYPDGHDQFLSMQGASWAVMALSYALGRRAASRRRRCRRRSRPASSPGSRRCCSARCADVRRLLDGGLEPERRDEVRRDDGADDGGAGRREDAAAARSRRRRQRPRADRDSRR